MKFIFTLRIFVLWLDLRKQLRGLVICSLRKEARIMILTLQASISEQDFFFISHMLCKWLIDTFDHMAQAELSVWANTYSVLKQFFLTLRAALARLEILNLNINCIIEILTRARGSM